MRHRSGWARWLAVILITVSATAALARPTPPELIIEAPDELRVAAQRIRGTDRNRLAVGMELLGRRGPEDPIKVILAVEDSPATRNVPSWVAGYAYGSLGTVVLLPGRTPSYPDTSLEELLRHEVAHVLTARAASGRPLPRWFNEGVAMIAGGSWSLQDRSRMTLAMLTGSPVPLAEVSRLFQGGRRSASRGYALSEAFVRLLLQRHGTGVVGDILSGVALGLPFEEAFHRATGHALAAAEKVFWRQESIWYRWVPVLTSSATLWLGITLLALVAFRRRRSRDKALYRQWEEEERLLEPPEEEEPLN